MSWIRRMPAGLWAALLLVALVLWFHGMGALRPDGIPVYASSRREVIGMALMLILLPPYFLVACAAVQRHSLVLIERLRSETPRPEDLDAARDAVVGGWRRSWPIGLVLGLAMGSLNTSIVDALHATVAPRVHQSLTVGQIVIWLVVGQVLAIRFAAARAFRELGRVLEIDLFRLDRLKPMARSGLADVMVIAGALALSPLQSLDAEFRWYNYHFALIVSIAATSLLLVWPLGPIHARIRAERERRLGALDTRIEVLSRAADAAGLVRLEALLAHRDRIAGLRTWIVSTDLAWRFVLYMIIPPLAWVGAAIVERAVDRALAP